MLQLRAQLARAKIVLADEERAAAVAEAPTKAFDAQQTSMTEPYHDEMPNDEPKKTGLKLRARTTPPKRALSSLSSSALNSPGGAGTGGGEHQDKGNAIKLGSLFGDKENAVKPSATTITVGAALMHDRVADATPPTLRGTA